MKEVVNIRDSAIGMTISQDRLQQFEELQGYRDIDPNNCWKKWCIYKKINES